LKYFCNKNSNKIIIKKDTQYFYCLVQHYLSFSIFWWY